jgi:nucleoside-diphosphate-sugar epimerase
MHPFCKNGGWFNNDATGKDLMKLFIFGAGYSSLTFVDHIKGEGHTISGTTRDEDKIEELRQAGIRPFLFDGEHGNDEIEHELGQTTHLLISIAPPRDAKGDAVDPVLQVFGKTITKSMPNLKWIGYLSTVGVYGNHDGGWVDESFATTPVSARSIQRDIAEKKWQAMAASIKVPLTILRLSGIFGPVRNAFQTIKAGRSRRLVKKDQVFNRIHVADIAQALDRASKSATNGIFNITDNEPAPPQDVVTFAHELMGIEPPLALDFETADITAMARSFYGENKRVSNAKSVAELGMVYQYPDYRTALEKMWREKSW